MTEYLDKCMRYCTPMSLHLVGSYYLMEEHPNFKSLTYPDGFVEGNGEALFQTLFDKLAFEMRMYGSAREFAENVRIYRNFPGSNRYFDTTHDPYNTTPIIYKSLKNEKFICKLDLFVFLQSMVVRSFVDSEPLIVISLIALFLKSQEKSLDGKFEFVRFNPEVLDEMWAEIQEPLKRVESFVRGDRSFKILLDTLSTGNVKDLLKRLKSYIQIKWNAEETKRIETLLTAFETIEMQRNAMARALMFTHSKVMIDSIRGIIEKRPEMFRPHSATENNTEPVAVRVFEDGGKRFVMKSEFFNALNEYTMGSVQIDYNDEKKIETLNWEVVLKIYGDDLKNMEFIRYPITHSKHRATPINLNGDPIEKNNFCLLIIDILFENLRSLIFDYKLFQKYGTPDFQLIEDIFVGTVHIYDPNAEQVYFLKASALPLLKQTMDTMIELLPELKSIIAKTAKHVRNAKKDGFTLQNLKNELEHLGLTVTFPEIQNHAEVVYEHVNRVKKERFLRTCDLFDAIEQCQLICIFERLPNLKKFLHNQGGCGRVIGLKCQLCMDQQKTLEIQKAESERKEAEEKLSKLEKELLQKTQENEELKMTIHTLTSENKTKSETIEKLMEKLSILESK